MSKRTLTVVLISLLAVLLVVGIAAAQSSSSFDLSWYVMGGSGGRVDSAAYAMNGTVGQGIVGLSGGSSAGMQSGYWYGASRPGYRLYLPLVLRNYP